MKKLILFLSIALFAQAHFLTLLPTTDNVFEEKESNLKIQAMFIHPFEQTGMNMEKPVGVYLNSKNNALPLKQINRFNHKSWSTSYKIKKPGVYKIFTIPKPYFEASEQKFISHIPKVIISAYGLEAGWDKPLGLKYEIIPMIKPFALYVGNQFKGKVLHNGKAAANVEVEVELYNEYGLKAPTPSHITQVIKTDDNGIFSFVMNHKGWWGFAALILEGEKEFQAKKYPVENGALLWVKAY